MVRHHVKKRKNGKANGAGSKEDKNQRLDRELGNLDRFAGSSDEESGSDESKMEAPTDQSDARECNDDRSQSASEEEDVSEEDYADVYEEKMSVSAINSKQSDAPDNDSDNGADDEDDYRNVADEDDMLPVADAKSAGMANAMSRIIGGQSNLFQQPSTFEKKTKSSKTVDKPVVLSKTTTPLQRLQQKIKSEEQALRHKRQNRREENLSAMRLPLAPTAGMSAEKLWKQTKKSKRKGGDSCEDQADHQSKNAIAIANEIESERTHRRIATRGVVHLFNAIAKHRAAVAAEFVAKEEEKQRIREEGKMGKMVRKMSVEDKVGGATSKFGFLDMIKKSASVTTSQTIGTKDDTGKKSSEEHAKSESTSMGWSALKDDYMMGSKMKDWDKVSESDGTSDGEDGVTATAGKKRKKV